MDKIVTNIEYTKKVLKDLNKNHFKYETRVARIIINIILIVDIIVNSMWLLIGNYDYFTSNLIFGQAILLLVAVITNTSVLADISTYMFLRTDKISLGLKTEMTFDNEKIITTNEMENMTLDYGKLYKIMETKEYIYLYINKQQAFIVNKENVSITELSELKNILKKKVKKYIEYMR